MYALNGNLQYNILIVQIIQINLTVHLRGRPYHVSPYSLHNVALQQPCNL
jgi:hypothetical protein